MASRASAVQDAAIAGIVALAISGAPTPTKRRSPTLPAGVSPPAIVVTVARRMGTEYLTNVANLRTYEVGVTVVRAGGDKLEDDDTGREWLEAIAEKFEAFATWNAGAAAVTGFNDVRVLDMMHYRRDAADKTLNYSTLLTRVEVLDNKP
jgi:hypothetical protein